MMFIIKLKSHSYTVHKPFFVIDFSYSKKDVDIFQVTVLVIKLYWVIDVE